MVCFDHWSDIISILQMFFNVVKLSPQPWCSNDIIEFFGKFSETLKDKKNQKNPKENTTCFEKIPRLQYKTFTLIKESNKKNKKIYK